VLDQRALFVRRDDVRLIQSHPDQIALRTKHAWGRSRLMLPFAGLQQIGDARFHFEKLLRVAGQLLFVRIPIYLLNYTY
jgi:hypothetical protein